METLPSEIINVIIGYLPPPCRANTLTISKVWYSATMSHSVSITTLSQLEDACCKGDVMSIAHSSRRTIDLTWIGNGLYSASRNGQAAVVECLVRIVGELDEIEANAGFNGACEGGHQEIAQLMLKLGADPVFGVRYAYRGGLLSENCCDLPGRLWCDGEAFIGACEGGHLDLARSALQSYHEMVESRKYSMAMASVRSALERGHLNIVEWLVREFAIVFPRNYYGYLLRDACSSNSRNAVDWVIDYAALNAVRLEDTDCDGGLYGACQAGNREFAEWLIELGAHGYRKYGFATACAGGHQEMAIWLMGLTPNGISDESLAIALELSCIENQKEIAMWLMSIGGDVFSGLFGACLGKRLRLFRWLVDSYLDTASHSEQCPKCFEPLSSH